MAWTRSRTSTKLSCCGVPLILKPNPLRAARNSVKVAGSSGPNTIGGRKLVVGNEAFAMIASARALADPYGSIGESASRSVQGWFARDGPAAASEDANSKRRGFHV